MRYCFGIVNRHTDRTGVDRSTGGAIASLYQEVKAGGFSHVDGTIEFYQRINALLSPDNTVLEFGAGRGGFVDDSVAYRRRLRWLRGKVASVVGVDIDEAILQNPSLDVALVITSGAPLPLEDGSVDIVVADWVFEHLRDPTWAASEIGRVLRRGGWICARTPNRYGYIAVASRLVPNSLHGRFLRRLQPAKLAQDTFPTMYRMNTRRTIERLFPTDMYEHCSYTMNSEPAYVGSSAVVPRILRCAFRLVPSALGAVHYLFIRKR